MEFVDFVIILTYIAFMLAFASVAWSVYRRNRKASGRLAIQNGIHVRKLNYGVWAVLLVVVLCAYVIGDHSVASIAVTTLSVMLLLTVGVVVWSLIRRR